MAVIFRMRLRTIFCAVFPVRQSALYRLCAAGPAAWHQGNRRFRAGRLYRRARWPAEVISRIAPLLGVPNTAPPTKLAAGASIMAPQSFGTMVAKKEMPAWWRPRNSQADFTGLTSDSRKVKPGYLFAALAGSKTDGARFVADAVARGAVAVLGAAGAGRRSRGAGRALHRRRKSARWAWRGWRRHILRRPARHRRRRHRHQGQILHRRLPARNLDGAGQARRQPGHGGRGRRPKARCRCPTPRPIRWKFTPCWRS